MFDQILDLVGQPPGSLVYHVIILFALEAAVAISMGQWMRERASGTLRLAIGSFALLLARMALVVASLAAWQGYLPHNVLLPPVERLVDTVTVLGLAWAFVTMDQPSLKRRNFSADVTAGLMLGLTLILFIGTYYFWTTSFSNNILFNGTWLDIAWSAAQVVIGVVGLVWMLTRIRYVYDPLLKGVMLILLAAAAAVHILQPTLGDVAAAQRVAQAIVIPMLAAVAFRHVVEQLLHWDEFEPSRLAAPAVGVAAPGAAPASPPAPPPGMADETVRHQPKPEKEEEAGPAPKKKEEAPQPAITPALLETVDAVGLLLSSLEPSNIVREAPKAVATALRADICVLAIVDEDVQEAAILGAYDNISQTGLRRDVLNLARHPSIVSALARLRQVRLTPQRNAGELRDIYDRLGITREGPAYIQPLVNNDDRVGVLILGSPYSGRHFSEEERNLLDRLAPLVTAALLNAEAYRAMQDKAEKAVAQEASRIVELADDVTAKTAELNAAKRQIEEMKAYIRDLHRQVEEFPVQQQAAQREIEKLLQEIETLRNEAARAARLEEELEAVRAAAAAPQAPAGEGMASEIAALRAQLAAARTFEEEVGLLQQQLAERTREVVKLRSRLVEAEAVVEALREQVRMMQDTGEVRGLDALQERIAGQARKIEALEGQLARAQALLDAEPSAAPRLEPERVDVLYAVEETITRLAGPLGERRITLRLAVPPSLPAIIADRQAVLDILYHLLNNAALASPDGSEVTLALSAQEGKLPVGDGREVEAPCLEIAVADTGAGVDPEHHERVFERAAEISGLGDRGDGLPRVRALVEAHGGCIWLESERGAGTTFHVRMPLEPVSVEDQS
ncbi:MAG TPA: ATP-binding protein [Aggregatilineales bacterium]|nr:ATP-binding protein [Aggregatilineales bacterium]